MRSLALPTLAPCEINRRLNEMLLRSTSASRYATMFYGDYDGRNRTLTYSNAGHDPPLHLGRDGATRLSEGGLPIGLIGDAVYGEGRCVLKEGDLLALCTDGVIEAPNAEEQEFGEERLLRILTEHRDRTLDEILWAVLEDVTLWRRGRPPHDDVTLVLARAT